jgi:hypothetical protein
MYGVSTDAPEFPDALYVPLVLHIADADDDQRLRRLDHPRHACRLWLNEQLLGNEYTATFIYYIRLKRAQGPAGDAFRAALERVRANSDKYKHTPNSGPLAPVAARARRGPAPPVMPFISAEAVLQLHPEGWASVQGCIARLTAMRAQEGGAGGGVYANRAPVPGMAAARMRLTRDRDETNIVHSNGSLRLVSQRTAHAVPLQGGGPAKTLPYRLFKTSQAINNLYAGYQQTLEEVPIDESVMGQGAGRALLCPRITTILTCLLSMRTEKHRAHPADLNELFAVSRSELETAGKYYNAAAGTVQDATRALINLSMALRQHLAANPHLI